MAEWSGDTHCVSWALSGVASASASAYLRPAPAHPALAPTYLQHPAILHQMETLSKKNWLIKCLSSIIFNSSPRGSESCSVSLLAWQCSCGVPGCGRGWWPHRTPLSLSHLSWAQPVVVATDNSRGYNTVLLVSGWQIIIITYQCFPYNIKIRCTLMVKCISMIKPERIVVKSFIGVESDIINK